MWESLELGLILAIAGMAATFGTLALIVTLINLLKKICSLHEKAPSGRKEK